MKHEDATLIKAFVYAAGTVAFLCLPGQKDQTAVLDALFLGILALAEVLSI